MRKTLKTLLALSLSASLATSCITTLSSSRINKVEVGMTKNEIAHLLGRPMSKNGYTLGEQWIYEKMIGEVAGPEEILFLVNFDDQGRVVGYQTLKNHPHHPH